MDQAITVTPSGNGWSVKSTPFDNEMFFASGSMAEAAARDLGARIAEVSFVVVIEVFLRDGSLAGRYVSAARKSQDPQHHSRWVEDAHKDRRPARQFD